MILEKRVIDKQLAAAYNDALDTITRASALWSLGYICLSDRGSTLLCTYHPTFVPWLVEFALQSPTLYLRGVAFTVPGTSVRWHSASLPMCCVRILTTTIVAIATDVVVVIANVIIINITIITATTPATATVTTTVITSTFTFVILFNALAQALSPAHPSGRRLSLSVAGCAPRRART